MIGKRFGKLVVVERRGTGKRRAAVWLCKCDCGQERLLETGPLNAGRVRSCGCLKNEMSAKRLRGNTLALTHGKNRTSEYRAWQGMVDRCEYPQTSSYPHYGGRGIAICAEWRRSFEAFFRDVGPRPTPQHSIDRIDVNGNYEPGNVRWATATDQQRNKRNNRVLEHAGQKMCVSAWADEVGLGAQTIRNRLDAGWTVERALSEPKAAPK